MGIVRSKNFCKKSSNAVDCSFLPWTESIAFATGQHLNLASEVVEKDEILAFANSTQLRREHEEKTQQKKDVVVKRRKKKKKKRVKHRYADPTKTDLPPILQPGSRLDQIAKRMSMDDEFVQIGKMKRKKAKTRRAQSLKAEAKRFRNWTAAKLEEVEKAANETVEDAILAAKPYHRYSLEIKIQRH